MATSWKIFFIKKIFVFAAVLTIARCAEEKVDNAAAATGDRPGHLQPLGSHRPPEGDIEVIDHVPHPIEFYKDYVQASKPVLMKGAARGSRAFQLWNDQYLTENFGNQIIMTEHGKKENRSEGTSNIQLKTFLRRYNGSNEFMVETLPPPMREDFQLLKSLLCGGFTNYLRDAVMWFSSGGTKSVLHYDNVDNINCLMSGTKDLFLVDKAHESLAQLIEGQAHSAVDVDRVDMDTFPGLGRVPWWRAHMDAGDCFYIPYKWLHQIRSFDRNLAINIWWVPVPKLNEADCFVDGQLGGERKNLDDYSSLSNFGFTPGESSRNELMELLKEGESGKLAAKTLMEMVYDMVEADDSQGTDKDKLLAERTAAVDEMFRVGDADGDGLLDGPEITTVPGRLIVDVFGSDTEEGQDPTEEKSVRDFYAHAHPEVEADELDVAEMDLPEGFEFPDDFDPDTYDIGEYMRAVEASKDKKDEEREGAAEHTEL